MFKTDSLKNKILFHIIGCIAIQVAIFISVIFLGRTANKLDQSATETVMNSVKSAGENMESIMAGWTDLSVLHADIQRNAEILAIEQRKPVSEVMKEASNREKLLDLSTDSVLQGLRDSGATACFIILENETQDAKKDALFLRDLDPKSNPQNNHDVLVEAGNGKQLLEKGFTLDSYWSAKLEITDKSLLYQVPFDAGNQYPDIDAENLGYFAQTYRLRPNDIEVIAYSIPLLDENHHSYGVIGYGITTDYLKKLMAQNDLAIDDQSSYCIGITEDHQNLKVVAATGKNFQSVLRAGTEIELKPSMEQKKIYRISIPKETTSYAGDVYDMNLYNTNTPFENQQWEICGIVRHAKIHSASKQLMVGLSISLLISLLVSIGLAILFTTKLTSKITLLMQGVRVLKPTEPSLPKTDIREFDELAEEIEKRNEEVYHSGAKVSNIIEMSDMKIGVLEYSSASREIYCTKNVFEILHEPIAEEWSENYILKEDAKRIFAKIIKKLQREEGEKYVYYYLNRHGKKRWFSIKLSGTTTNGICVLVDITADMIEKEKIKHERDYDVLTNLYNRRALEHEITRLIHDRVCKNALFSIWDLDNLKYVNDSFGHDMGDKYIRLLAEVFKQMECDNAVVSRLSGDEFVVFLYNMPKEDMLKQVQHLHDEFINSKLKLPDGGYLNASASTGVSFFDEDGSNYTELYRYADFAMYEIKKSNKGNIRIFNKEAYTKDNVLIRGIGELDRILKEESVRYAFQPIVDLQTFEIHAYEALIRPVSDTIQNPDALLRMAESQSKLRGIETITWFHALKDFFAQIDKDSKQLVFINSLPSQFLSDKEREELQDLYGSKMSKVVMEITEQSEIDDAMEQMKSDWCGRMHIATALDDYGSGYSNSNTLVTRTFDYVKLDMSLVRDIHLSTSKQNLVAGVISYGHENNIKIIAEGIEHKEELETVMKLGVNYGQGYYFAKPEFTLCKEIPKERF